MIYSNSSKYLLFGVYFSLHQRNTVYKCKLQRKPIINKIQVDLHFHLPLILILKRSVIKRTTDSTTSTTSGQTDTTSGQTDTTSGQTVGQTSTTSGQTEFTSGQTSTTSRQTNGQVSTTSGQTNATSA